MPKSLDSLVEVECSNRHVAVEALTLEHATELVDLGADPRIWTYMARGPFDDVDDARRFIEAKLHRRQRHEELPFAVRTRSSGALVGCASYLAIEGRSRSVEIGSIFFHPTSWGGPAPAAAIALLAEHAFSYDTGRVWFKTDARNQRATRALTRAGIHFEGVLRKHQFVRDGYIRDSAVFSILDNEWPSIRERLERLLSRG